MKFKTWLEESKTSNLGIISDIHEDIQHLKEAFAILNECSSIVCLGDLTGYNPKHAYFSSRNAHAVVDIIKNKCDLCVIGNHDLHSINKLPKIKAKGKTLSYEDLSPSLTKEDKKFIQQLPEYVSKKYGNLKILFSHYAFPNLSGTTEFDPTTPKDVKQHFAFMQKNDCTLGISGHDHFEGIKVFTENKVRKVPFNTPVKLTNDLTWIYGPSVGRKNEILNAKTGVLILDTNKMEIKAIPLK